MVRVPATLVGLLLALTLGGLTYLLAFFTRQPQLVNVLLPVWTAIGGFVAVRWGYRVPPVPGISVGLLFVAVQLGLGSGSEFGMFAFISPTVALIEIIGSLLGGLVATLVLRRSIPKREHIVVGQKRSEVSGQSLGT